MNIQIKAKLSMYRKVFLGLVGLLLVTVIGTSTADDPVQWQQEDSANDHWNETVTPSLAVNASSLTFLKNIPLYPGQINGLKPSKIAINDNKNLIYVVNQKSNSVSVINGSTNTVIKSIAVEKNPQSIAIDILRNKIYVSNSGSSSISVIDGVTSKIIARIDLKPYTTASPISLAVNPATKRLYVGFRDNGLIVINTANNAFLKKIPLGWYTGNISINSKTNRIYVLGYIYNEGYKVFVLSGVSIL